MTRSAPLGLALTPFDLAARVVSVRSSETLARFWSDMEPVPHPDRDEPLGLDYQDALDAPH